MLEENIPEEVDEQSLKEEFMGTFDPLVVRCQQGMGQHLIYCKPKGNWYISDRGLTYLDKLRNQEIQQNQTEILKQQSETQSKLNLLTFVLCLATTLYALLYFLQIIIQYPAPEKAVSDLGTKVW